MNSIKDIKNEIERISVMKILVETYEAVASTSMRKIRTSVLENRAFHEGLKRLYAEVKQAYRKELQALTERARIPQVTTASVSLGSHNGRTVSVLLMASAGLYGDIMAKTFSFFMEEYKHNPGDVVIIGKTGKLLFEEAMPGIPYRYFDFPDDDIDVGQLAVISRYLSQFENVLVFHGTFKSFFLQRPTFANLRGTMYDQEQPAAAVEETKFDFEPSLGQVALFFEIEIFASLLEQVFYESRLAKLASRILLLQRAMTHIDTASKSALLQRRRIHHRLGNKKIVDANSSISVWSRVR